MKQKNGMERVTRHKPCTLCGGVDWCTKLTRYIWCMRTESNKPHPKGGWLHPIKGAKLLPIPSRPMAVSDESLRDRWTPIALAAEKNGLDRMPALAVSLGVSCASLQLLHVGYAEIGSSWCYTFPERNARGWIIGINRRLETPINGKNKLFCRGGRRGLTYIDDWHKSHGPIFLVEGGSDCAAAISLGLCVVGRPSNVGGIEILIQLLRPHRRKIVVLGENDHKAKITVQQKNPHHEASCEGCMACWPGKAGAIQTARALSSKLHRQVRVMFPPRQYKDLRDYVASLHLNWKDLQEGISYGATLKAGHFPIAARQDIPDDKESLWLDT